MVKYATLKVNQQIPCRVVTPIIGKNRKGQQQASSKSMNPALSRYSRAVMICTTQLGIKNVNFTHGRQFYDSLELSE
jgi:hypothetical protein